MKILVTGGLGFIGSHTVVELQHQGFEVVVIDNLSNSSEDVLQGIGAITGKEPIFENLDLRDKKKLNGFFEKYPDSPNPLGEPAVLLIDEIDLHLHPKLQRGSWRKIRRTRVHCTI